VGVGGVGGYGGGGMQHVGEDLPVAACDGHGLEDWAVSFIYVRVVEWCRVGLPRW
jgi:hypothetical protein